MSLVNSKFASYAYAALRIIAGLMFMMHGTQKLFNFPPGEHGPFAIASLPGVAGVLELVMKSMICCRVGSPLFAFCLVIGPLDRALPAENQPAGANPADSPDPDSGTKRCRKFARPAKHSKRIGS